MQINILVHIESNGTETIDIPLTLEKAENLNRWSYMENLDILLTIEADEDNSNAKITHKGSLIIDSDHDIIAVFNDAITDFEMDKRYIQEVEGIEIDNLESDSPELFEDITEPYNPKMIRVDSVNYPIYQAYMMIEENEIDLSPDFQRNFVWTDLTRKSRLIESILLRIPLPVFYMARDKKGTYQVIDGVQRLTVIQSYMNNEFRLKNLEYMKDCEGLYYDNPKASENLRLPIQYKRRIRDAQLFFNVIDPQTPEKVKYDIFKRINTGGQNLNQQEIRNCLAKPHTRNLIRKLATSKSFVRATRGSVNPKRMADQELVLRFIAFYLLDNGISDRSYKGAMDVFLDDTVEFLNENPTDFYSDLENCFYRSMDNAYILFGERAFRKASFINKSLFLALSRQLYKFTLDADDNLKNIATKTLQCRIDEDILFNDVLSNGTNDAKRISIAYECCTKVLEEVLNV